jgi:hypothetical protein
MFCHAAVLMTLGRHAHAPELVPRFLQITHGIKSEVDSQHRMLDGMVRCDHAAQRLLMKCLFQAL